jgi:hypothetical protein
VVPFLVSRQFQRPDYLYEAVPFLDVRKKALQDLDEWLAHTPLRPVPKELVTVTRPKALLTRLSSFGSLDLDRKDAADADSRDILKCFAVVKEHVPGPVAEVGFCRRITSLLSYMTANR